MMHSVGNYNRDNRSNSRRNSGGGDYRRSGNRGGGGGRREMFDAVCDKCGKDCKVPFRPTSGKPVYCSDCFEKTSDRGGSNSRNYQDRGPRRSSGGAGGDYRRSSPRPQNNEQLEAISQKLDKIIEMLSNKPLREVEVIVDERDEEKTKAKKKKATKKKTASKKKKAS